MPGDVLLQVAVAAFFAAHVSAEDLLTPAEARLVDTKLLLMTEEELENSRFTMKRKMTSPNSYVLYTIASHCKKSKKDVCPYKQFQLAAFYDVTRTAQKFLIKAMGYGYQAYTKAEDAGNFNHIKGIVRKQSPEDAYILKIKAIVDGFVKKIYAADKISDAELPWHNDGDTAVEADFKDRTKGSGSSVQTEWDDTAYEGAVVDTTIDQVKAQIIPKLMTQLGDLDIEQTHNFQGRTAVRRTLITKPITYVLCVIENKCRKLEQTCPFNDLQFTASYDVTTAGSVVTVTAMEYNFLATKERQDDFKFAQVKEAAGKKTPEGVFIWKIKERFDEKIKKLFNVANINNKDREWKNGGTVAVEEEFVNTQKKNKIPTAVAKVTWS